MNEFEHIEQLIPDYINGTIDEDTKLLVERAIATSPSLKKMHNDFLCVFESLNKEDIQSLMLAESNSVNIPIPDKVGNVHTIPKIMIGAITTIAACLILWIGISHQQVAPSTDIQSTISSNVFVNNSVDEFDLLELQSEDLEEVILEDVLDLYVSDIETEKDINPLLEEEITKYLLKDNHDDEVL